MKTDNIVEIIRLRSINFTSLTLHNFTVLENNISANRIISPLLISQSLRSEMLFKNHSVSFVWVVWLYDSFSHFLLIHMKVNSINMAPLLCGFDCCSLRGVPLSFLELLVTFLLLLIQFRQFLHCRFWKFFSFSIVGWHSLKIKYKLMLIFIKNTCPLLNPIPVPTLIFHTGK